MADSQSNDNTTCVVCFKNVLYFSIGECDHPVCFECSTRMRVLCLQNECPICRHELARVVFTESIQPYKELYNKVFSDKLFERQFKIGFCSEEIKNAYESLLENRCKLCENLKPFRAFNMLSDHMRKVHERFFCDLCVKHLTIFTSERKCYTRQELGHHRRRGDVDDTSHRGHPLCEFCEERFMDADELYRHLRKEHLYCHLCDADGKNLYYASHPALAQHFRNDHYLCEEGECAGQHLTAVFRSEIDLKAHKATVHGRGMPRGAARLARTLELQFNITPHPVAQRTPRERPEPPASPPAAAPEIDTRNNQQFPRLSAAPATPNLVLTAPSRTYKGGDTLTRNDKNFPALEGGATSRPAASARPGAPVAATIVRNSKPSVSIQLHSQPASASNFRLTQTGGNRISIPAQNRNSTLSDDDFPSLSVARDDHPSIGAGTVQPSKVALINSQEMQSFKNNLSNPRQHKPPLNSEAFPALSSSPAPAAPPQWITVSKPKGKPKPAKPNPPQPNEPKFNPVADFPTLPANTKLNNKKSSQPVQQQAPSQTDNVKSKKEKKKQNNAKKENLNEINHINGLIERKDYYEATKIDNKIQTVESTSAVSVNSERDRNGGNGDFSLTAKDYPPLATNDNSDYPPLSAKNEIPNKKLPNGSVPPGFKPRPPCDGMTFTNSTGQTFSAPVHTYIPPPSFEQRNRALVKKFVAALGSAEAVEDFKVASRAFRDNIISAEEFYQHCRIAMDSELDSVFLELVALLPDIAKQQELVVGRNLVRELDVCSICGQLLAPEDKVPHDTAHWPPLGTR